MSRARMVKCGLSLIVGCVICWCFPLFHIRTLESGTTKADDSPATSSAASPTDPSSFMREFWDGPLRTGDAATEITQLWNAFDADAEQAQSRYGRQAGLGGAWYFCLRGEGTVETVEQNRVVLTVTGLDSPRRVSLELGVVVDNTVREALGVKASDYANSQEFNEVSSELNLRVEKQVIAENRALLKEGVIVDFVGCAKVSAPSDLDPLCLIPIQLRTRSSQSLNNDATGAAP